MENYQQIIVYLIVILAVRFLIRKYFFKNKNTTKSCGKDGKGCH